MLPGQVVLTVKTDSPGGTGIQFNVTLSPITGTDYLTITHSIVAYNTDEGADLAVLLPNGGSFSFHVLSFNSFGSLGTVDSIDVINVPTGNCTSVISKICCSKVLHMLLCMELKCNIFYTMSNCKNIIVHHLTLNEDFLSWKFQM